MSLNVPGLDVSMRVRARDIQMAAVANVRQRVLMISGAIDATDHDLSMCINLPEPGIWHVVKCETNLTDQVCVAMQVTCDEDSHFVDGPDTTVMCRQFARTFMTPDCRRLMFYDGEVRPGEAMLKMFTIECATRRPAYAHARYCTAPGTTAEMHAEAIEKMMADGMPQRPVIELMVPVTVIG